MRYSNLIAGGVLSGLMISALPIFTSGAQASSWISDKEPMPGVPAAAWAEFVGPTPEHLRPKGRKIAGLKFDPKRDGFFFFNYSNSNSSDSNQLNNYLWNTGTGKIKNLGAKQLVNLFGRDQVCLPTKNVRRNCVLTASAKSWMESINTNMNSGHCFGIAATVAQLYAGSTTSSQLGGKAHPHSIPLKPKLTRLIAQNFAMQLTNRISEDLTPRQAIRVLKRSFKANQPMVMAVKDSFGSGHAITPIGLYKRGKHKYDIAVYDSNFPDRVRAVHADTSLVPGTKQQVGFDYLMLEATEGQPQIKMAGNVGLVPLSELAGRQEAPFVPSSNLATVTIAPNASQHRLRVKITRPDGSRIKGLKTRTQYSVSPDRAQVFPEYVVPAGTSFKLRVSNADNSEVVSTSVRIHAGDTVASLDGMKLPGHSVDSITFRPKSGTLRYDTSGGTDPSVKYINSIEAGRAAELMLQSADLPPQGGFISKLGKAGDFTYRPTIPTAAANFIEFALTQVSVTPAGSAVEVTVPAPSQATIPDGGYFTWNYLKGNPRSTNLTVNLVAANGVSTSQHVKGIKQVVG